jgi:hypothetical protein
MWQPKRGTGNSQLKLATNRAARLNIFVGGFPAPAPEERPSLAQGGSPGKPATDNCQPQLATDNLQLQPWRVIPSSSSEGAPQA